MAHERGDQLGRVRRVLAAGGRAALLAAGETWQLIEHPDWPVWLFWALVVVMLAAAMLNTAARMSGDQRRPAGAEPAPAAEPR